MAGKQVIWGVVGFAAGWFVAGMLIPESACVFSNFGCVENLFVAKIVLAAIGGFIAYKMA